MDYSHPFFSSDDITIPIPNPNQHPSAPLQVLRRESYSTLNDAMANSLIGISNPPQGQIISPIDDSEDMDTSSRPRLTQDQIAILEAEFKGKPKPGTEFKKRLASRIGLSLQRVNNWYQNRRAKARHQRPQERRFDVLPPDPNDPNAQWAAANLSFVNFQNGQDQFLDSNQQISSEDFMTIPNDELAELSKPFSPNLAHTATDLMQGPNNTGGMDNEHDIDSKIGTLYSPIVQGISDPKMSMSFAQDWDINNWVTNIQPEEPFHHDDPTAVGGPFNAYSHLMYRNSGEGYPMGNHSCNTFVTTSSSDGDPCLMTPPPKTSPMPIVPQESLPRRGSNSSELVNDLNTICIQPSWSHPGWYEGSYYHPPMLDIGPAMDHSPKMPQPQIAVTNSPTLVDLNKTTSKISAVPLVDLAARRNRPRPATLRPDAHRSQSYAGPLTMSPTSKVPSLGIASSPSVRRIKSTGQNLNVASNGRIQKSGPASAQLSPRNLQSFMDAAGLSQSRFPKRQNTDTSQSPAPNCTPLTPLSSGKLDFVKPEPQPSRSPFVGPAAPGWNQTYGHSAPNAFDDVAHDIKSPPITPFNVEAFPQMISHDRKHDSFYPCPPQSAPPQQTSFFGDSPTLPAANASHQSWQVPSSSLLLETYPDDRMSIPRPIQMPQLGYPEQHSQYMTPLHQYLRGPSSMMNGLPNYFANSTPPPKDLEIQVHLIPKPQGAPQARKKYTFNNTTPKDFLQTVY